MLRFRKLILASAAILLAVTTLAQNKTYTIKAGANRKVLQKTIDDCSRHGGFSISNVNCTVNGSVIPEHPAEDSERRQCDVW